jgi:hypothetical protein
VIGTVKEEYVDGILKAVTVGAMRSTDKVVAETVLEGELSSYGLALS